jgi:DNA polymerase-1
MLVNNDNFTSILNNLENHTEVAVDLETTGLTPVRATKKDVIAGIAIGTKDKQSFYFPYSHSYGANLHYDTIHQVIEFLETREKLKNHNIKFDLRFLAAAGMSKFPPLVDTQNGVYLYNEEVGRGLKYFCSTFVNPESAFEEKELEKQLLSWGYPKQDMWRLHPEKVAPYAEKDTLLVYDLEAYLEHRLDSKVRPLWDELNTNLGVLLKMELSGLRIDEMRRQQLENEATMEAFKIEQAMKARFGRNFNINSPAQLKKWFKLPDTTEDTLLSVAEKIPEVKEILKWRWWSKAINTYYKPYKDFIVDGYLHPNFSLTGTVGGRLSSNDPNILAVPRYSTEQKVKEIVIPDSPDEILVEIDYSQAEIRLAAHYTKEETIINAIREGRDIHQTVADEVGISRQDAKTLNFAMVYGAGAKRLAQTLNRPVEYAQQLLAGYHGRYPGYRKVSKAAERTAMECGFVQMWNYRRRHFSKSDSEPHTAFNQIIQGGVAQMVLRTMNKISAARPDLKLKLQIHDALIFSTPKEGLRDTIKQVKEIMEYQPQFLVPMNVDVKVGDRWSNLKTVKDI